MNNKYRILSKTVRETELWEKKAAVILYLYYPDTVDFYYSYLERIPKEVDIYIITSNPELLEQCRLWSQKLEGQVFVKIKPNRGRDVSALLVVGKDILQQYTYVCFLHDKRPKHPVLQDEVKEWCTSICENLLGSKVLIENILGVLESEKDVGLFVPPAPYGENIPRWYSNSWLKNYENAKRLCAKLDVHVQFTYEDAPIALGTVFWAKADLFQKLLTYPWTYEDFCDEPFPADGSISHAIERIIPYLAEDAGYQTRIIMNHSYAEYFLQNVQTDMNRMFDKMGEGYGIRNMHDFFVYEERNAAMQKFLADADKVYIYGAGVRGADCYKNLHQIGIETDGYLVTKKSAQDKSQSSIYELTEIENTARTKIIVAVSLAYETEILNYLHKQGVDAANVYVY